MNVHKFIKHYTVEHEELEQLISDAESMGYRFIEVKRGGFSKVRDHIAGLDELRPIMSRAYGTDVPVVQGMKIVKDGSVHFYPDNRAQRWGYVLDTPKNRRWLAAVLASEQYNVTDNKIKGEIIDLAIKEGFNSKKRDVDNVDKHLFTYMKSDTRQAEIDILTKLAELEQENEKLKAALESTEVKKPLAGKHVKVNTTGE